MNALEHYLESPTVNTKTYTYHARIHVSCMKPLFITLKNEMFLRWLIDNRILLEEKDSLEILPANVELIMFIHPHNSLIQHHHEQLRLTFIGTAAPEFKIKP